MSVVTGVVFQTSSTEDGFDPERGTWQLDKLNTWLVTQGYAPLKDLADDHAVGNKHPQINVYVAGYNYFIRDEFVSFLRTLTFQHPEQVVLLTTREEDAAEVWRPKH